MASGSKRAFCVLGFHEMRLLRQCNSNSVLNIKSSGLTPMGSFFWGFGKKNIVTYVVNRHRVWIGNWIYWTLTQFVTTLYKSLVCTQLSSVIHRFTRHCFITVLTGLYCVMASNSGDSSAPAPLPGATLTTTPDPH
jgi:hypothetical protein